jgi:hypothetical protein
MILREDDLRNAMYKTRQVLKEVQKKEVDKVATKVDKTTWILHHKDIDPEYAKNKFIITLERSRNNR